VRRWDFVPFDFIGKGGKGYVLKEWVIHKGKGSVKPKKKFRKAVQLFGSEKEHMLDQYTRERVKRGGPRYANIAARTFRI